RSLFFFSSRRRHTRSYGDWSSDVCSSDLTPPDTAANGYVMISPSASGVYHGHLREHAADIIPPFLYSGQTYSLNWDTTGQAIFKIGRASCRERGWKSAGAAGVKSRHQHHR